ncbi:helix-turn-helix domain-containing protein [Devosia sp. FJ2-5-3]|uniref:helix-turn-helix domain-containing protein n=1 Tax=Devosia sp. FJ2-5-3 TaxID=2976680 RepID=UPI0023D7F557|nr:helix-turn-helix domain-containing protein [Devosia sp. FJ2-5-3]WEJ58201.1 helix-turn-helix domain-containing protein [Devosia sp. FJ2-5-3]
MHYPNMNHIPVYALYGEQEVSQDWLHWETIQSRSRLHGYRIAPHRHEQFFQVLHLTGGWARVGIDDASFDIRHEGVVVLPALSVHGFLFSDDVEGIVVTLMERDLVGMGLGLPGPQVLQGTSLFIGDAIDRLIGEADRPGSDHEAAMRAHLTLLLVALNRASQEAAPAGGPAQRALIHAKAFRALVDQRFRETRRIGDYAELLGISQTHLNRVCREVLGASALEVVERRLALEARRMLAFSSLSIKQIGAELGYEDPAYFSRVLTRVLGAPPGEIRKGALEREG